MPAPDLDVRYVAKLARLALTDEEARIYGSQLAGILEHVSALNELDTSDVAATAQVVESRNAWRDDAVTACLPREEVLEEAPRAQGAYIRVPRIIGEGS
jgi:aspartyl-tRNA(Asn)/glutamyl-tRNA(Gln) amidotransferase subunit C